MNILFIPTKDPRLKNGGNEQRTNLLWESLKRYGTVYTFLSDSKLINELEIIDGPYPICKYRTIVNKWSLWYFLNVIVNRFSPFCIWKRKYVKLPDVTSVFKGVKFDLVVTRYIHPLCEHKYWKFAPLLIDIDDHPSQVYNTIYKQRLPMGLRTIGKYITEWQTKYLLSKASGGWIANGEQLSSCGASFCFLPNIPQNPTDNYKVDSKDRKNLFTVGAMGYGPNKEGITRFLTQIWPLFHKKYPDVQYFIVGKGASETDVDMWNSLDGVKYMGYADDLEAIYEKTLATVVPVYSGGGTCIKTLEAMAYSRACLSTKFGARGLSNDIIENEKGVLLFDDAETFIDAYQKILDDKRRAEIESQGYNVIAKYYSADCFDMAVDNVVLEFKK